MTDSYVELHDDPNDDLEDDDTLDQQVSDDDEGDLPPDDGGEDRPPADDDDAPPQRQESRAQRRIRQLSDEVRELRESRQPAAPQSQQPAVDPAEEDRRFLASIAELPFDQQLVAVRNRERQVVGQNLNRLELRMAQSDDRAAFSDLKRDNPLAARHSVEVERQFKEYADKGQFVSRELLLYNIVGKATIERGPRAIAKDRKRAGENIERQRGRPAARRSDTTGGGRPDANSPDAVEGRLRDAFNRGATLADI